MKLPKKSILWGIIGVSFLYSQVAPPPEQFSVEAVKNVNLKNANQLVKLIKEEKIRSSIKEAAFRRIRELYLLAPEEAEKQVPQFIDAGSYALKKYQNEPSYKKTRMEACTTLGAFNESKHKDKAVLAIETGVLQEKDPDVVTTCSQMLGFFYKNSKAAQILIKRLEKHLPKNPITEEDVQIVSVVVSSLGRIRSKVAFIPLMKLLQSAYPVGVKREAEYAIENIEWD